MKITHYDLCKKTAERFLKESEIVLYEYQNWATSEFPDVLCFNGGYTTLFEIKIDYQDFKKDDKKDCRSEISIKYWTHLHRIKDKATRIIFDDPRMQEFIKEAPHLGRRRYYVCPMNLIQPDEIENGWGLYWYNGRFSKRKESKQFKHNMFAEMNILSHAFRRYSNGSPGNIIVKPYQKNY